MVSDATTPNYGWSFPTNGADSSTWGQTLNTTIVAIDVQVKTVSNNTVASGGGASQSALGTFGMAVGMDTGGSALRASRSGSDLGYLLRSTFSAGGPASGGFVTISTGAPSGTPNDGDLWLQYS